LIQVTVDSLVRLVAYGLGFDPGETLYNQLFFSSPTIADRSSGDYADGAFYAQCVDLAVGVVDAAGLGVTNAVGALDRAIANRTARLAAEAAKAAEEAAAKGGERAIDRLGKNLRDINPERVRVENARGTVDRGRNAAGGYTSRGSS
jgi:hypothetical protein